jgi:hypothetical protein
MLSNGLAPSPALLLARSVTRNGLPCDPERIIDLIESDNLLQKDLDRHSSGEGFDPEPFLHLGG